MARVYVKGYTKKDGTKVHGHYREVNLNSFDRTVIAQGVRKFRQIPKDEKAVVLKNFANARRKYSYNGDTRAASLRELYKAQMFARAYKLSTRKTRRK